MASTASLDVLLCKCRFALVISCAHKMWLCGCVLLLYGLCCAQGEILFVVSTLLMAPALFSLTVGRATTARLRPLLWMCLCVIAGLPVLYVVRTKYGYKVVLYCYTVCVTRKVRFFCCLHSSYGCRVFFLDCWKSYYSVASTTSLDVLVCRCRFVCV